jgi:cell division protein ZapA (FtsZ GTPase activity inhibitor)
MSELSIKVVIASRTYPLTIKREEEEGVRKAAKLINDKIKEYEENYFVRDKQDLLAMCALQLAAENTRQGQNNKVTLDEGLADRIVEIEKFVSDYLKRE